MLDEGTLAGSKALHHNIGESWILTGDENSNALASDKIHDAGDLVGTLRQRLRGGIDPDASLAESFPLGRGFRNRVASHHGHLEALRVQVLAQEVDLRFFPARAQSVQ